MNDEDNNENNPENFDDIEYLKMIFWLGLNDSRQYKTEFHPHWDQRMIDAYMEGQEFFIRHKLGVPFVRLD